MFEMQSAKYRQVREKDWSYARTDYLDESKHFS